MAKSVCNWTNMKFELTGDPALCLSYAAIYTDKMVRKFFKCIFRHLQGLEKICPLRQALKPWLFFPFRQAKKKKKSQYVWLISLFLYKPDRIKSLPTLPRMDFPETSTFERLSFFWTPHREHQSCFSSLSRLAECLTDGGFITWGHGRVLRQAASLWGLSSAQAELKVARRGSNNSINERSGLKVNEAFPLTPLGPRVLGPLDSDWSTPPAFLGVQLAYGRSWGLFSLHNHVNQFISFYVYAYRYTHLYSKYM